MNVRLASGRGRDPRSRSFGKGSQRRSWVGAPFGTPLLYMDFPPIKASSPPSIGHVRFGRRLNLRLASPGGRAHSPAIGVAQQ